MQKSMIMCMVKIDQKYRTIKVISANVLPDKRKDPAATGSIQNK